MMKIKISNMKAFAIAGFTFLIAACGTINYVSIESIQISAFQSKTNGVIIFSLGARNACTSFATGLYIENAMTGERVPGIPAIFVDNRFQKSDFTDHFGAVDALALPPGNYYFSAGIINPMERTIKAPRFYFEVRPAETTYVGEMYMTISCGDIGQFIVRDQFDRDMQIIAQKNPAALQRVPVNRNVEIK